MFLFQLSREIILTCLVTDQYLCYKYFILVLVGGLITEGIVTIISWQQIITPERNRKTHEDKHISVYKLRAIVVKLLN